VFARAAIFNRDLPRVHGGPRAAHLQDAVARRVRNAQSQIVCAFLGQVSYPPPFQRVLC